MKEESRQTKRRLQGEFLEEIINKNFHSSSIILNRGKELGYNLTLNQAVLQIKLVECQENTHLSQLSDLLYDDVTQFMNQKNRQFIMRNRLDGLIVLLEIRAEKRSHRQDSVELAKDILDLWKEKMPENKIIIGIGKTYSNVNQLSESAHGAKYAVDLAGLLLSKKEIVHFDDLATFHLLIQMKEMGLSLQTFYEEQIGELLLKRKQGIDLIQTLEAYFLNNLNLQSTAAFLFIHRHTLKYRLNQIEQRTGFNLNSADERLTLQLAIAAYRLEKYFE